MTPLLRARTEEIVTRIRRYSSASFKKQMAQRFGINTQYALGTPVTQLRLIAKSLPKPDQPLAEALWQTGSHEARILASLLADPKQMTREKLNAWVKDLNSWDICDACCANLFSKVKSPLQLAERWIKKEEEFTRFYLLSKSTRATRAPWSIKPSTGRFAALARKTPALPPRP